MITARARLIPETRISERLPVLFFRPRSLTEGGDMSDGNFSADFEHLADRFLRIEANTSLDGQRYIRNVSTQAAKTLKRCLDSGALVWPGTDFDWPEPPDKLGADDRYEALLELAWMGVCLLVAREYPDHLPSNITLLQGNWGSFKDWKQRASNYAEVCRLLAEICDGKNREEGAYSRGRTWAEWRSGFKCSGCGPSKTTFYRKIGDDNPVVRSTKIEGTQRIRLHNGDMEKAGWKYVDSENERD